MQYNCGTVTTYFITASIIFVMTVANIVNTIILNILNDIVKKTYEDDYISLLIILC